MLLRGLPFSLIPSFKLDGMTSSALVNTGVDDMRRRLSIVRILPLSSAIHLQFLCKQTSTQFFSGVHLLE